MNTSASLASSSVVAWLLTLGCAGADKFFSQSGEPNASQASADAGSPSAGFGGAADTGPSQGDDSGAASSSQLPTAGGTANETGASGAANGAGAPALELAGGGGASASGGASVGGADSGGTSASGGVPASAGQSGSSPVDVCSPGCCGSALKSAVADSGRGFSATQGACGWSYGYLLAGAEPFAKLTLYDTRLFDTPAWVTSAKQPPWLATLATIQHPNADPAQWNDRRWTSTVDGLVSIRGHVAKSDTRGGDGIIAHVRVAGVELWKAPIAYSDEVGKDFALTASVQFGTQIDFLIEAGANDQHDTTTLTAVITK